MVNKMKTDRNGCSTTSPGEEHWEEFYSSVSRQEMVQYDYRTTWGKLFSCVAKTLDAARRKRDAWLKKEIAWD